MDLVELRVLGHGDRTCPGARRSSLGRIGETLCDDIAVDAERVVREHVLAHPLERVGRRHAPVRGAGRDDLDKRVPDAVDLVLESLPDRLLRGPDALRRVNADAFEIRHAIKGAQKLAYADRIAGGGDVAPVGRGLRDLVGQARRSHLAAGHAVNGVVDEDYGQLLAAGGRMDRLCHADGGQVAIALVGEHDLVGMHALHPGGHGGGAAVGGLEEIAIVEVVHHDGAADRRDADGVPLDTQFVYNLGHEAVHDAVRATGTIVRDDGRQGMRALIDDFLFRLGHVTHPALR